MKKRALGKGLNALITDLPSDIVSEEDEKNIQELPLSRIIPNPNQPRKHFDEEKLTELSNSIKENGVIQPILVVPHADGYQIVVGERRYRASKLAGVSRIPCIVKEISEEKIMELALIENIQREDLNAIETARSYQELMNQFNLTQEALSVKIGKSRSAIANTLRLLRLPEQIQNDIIDNALTEGHARAILTLNEVDQMLAVREKIIDKGLSVREAEALAKDILNQGKIKKKTEKEKAVEIVELEQKFTELVGTRVKIQHKANNKGKIEIEYYNLDDFEKIKAIIENSSSSN